MNGWKKALGGSPAAPAGWNEWHTQFPGGGYYNYDLAVNGQIVHYGRTDNAHLTRVLNAKAVSLVRQYAPRASPFYLQLDHLAPHGGTGDRTGRCPKGPVPDPSDALLFANEPLPGPPSFNEADVSDKPSFLQTRPLLSSAQIASLEKRYRCSLASLRAVDRGVQQVYQAFSDARELQRTVFIFTTDNGLFYGEHRLPGGKTLPYEEAIEVPLVVRTPRELNGGRAPASTVSKAVANIDLAPTILEIAGASACSSATACRVMDGRSLFGLIRGQTAGWPEDRGLLVEYDSRTEQSDEVPSEAPNPHHSCRYDGIRMRGEIYVEHSLVPNLDTGLCEPVDEVEHYDLGDDPFQLQNLYPAADPSVEQSQQEFADRLDTLRGCAGIEGRDPPPAAGSYCE